ncbi:MAG: [FeFe] hydrogenase H-cluster radical SAM maturase HydE [Candidatus Omnitrophica bacterium]|nr:[FeFe] hydrogenase H-cluster radical SAM maturase HydE [Candidatus Omnitrophota bacterium]
MITEDLKNKFEEFARETLAKHGVVLQLAEIRGERWAYALGERPLEIPAMEPLKVRLGDHAGVIVYEMHGHDAMVLDHVRGQVKLLWQAQGSEDPGRMKELSRDEMVEYLNTTDPAKIEELFSIADSVRKRYVGDEVHLRGIIEFSNYCSKDCLYCGLRCSNPMRPRYRMSCEEIFNAARNAHDLGYGTVVLQSGEDAGVSVREMYAVVGRIKKELDLAVTLSMGELSYDDLKRLRSAGADRYLMRFETSDRRIFRELKPDSDHDRRLGAIYNMKELGYEVGSGIMIGLPGQTVESIADDIMLFRSLDLDMIGCGPFIPNPETPLAGNKGGDITLALKVIALARILTRDTNIPATTAIGTIDPEGRQKGLKCGANVIMPNVTPREYRASYLLYPDKICIDEDPGDCAGCVAAMIASVGRIVGRGKGFRSRRA